MADVFSMNLSKFLEEIIGMRDVIQKRQRMFDILSCCESIESNDNLKYISTGSKAEGLYLNGSDTDTMVVFNRVNVLDLEQCKSSQTVFMNARLSYAPECQGTVFLKVHDIQKQSCSTYEDNIFESLIQYRDHTIVSSTLFREQFVSFLNSGLFQSDQGKSNGPCFTAKLPNADLAPAFHCSIWPKCVMEWSKRQRPYGWPSFALIKRIEKDGCYVVPKGEDISNNSDVLWRISFATAETKLIRSLSDVQFKTYALLKIVLKENNNFRCVRDTDGPVLSSYLMKTVIFYVVENTPSSFWVDVNLFKCFWLCLHFLINCVKTGFCPSYFFPSKNLFRKRVFGRKRLALLRNLQIFRNKGTHCLDQCSSLDRIRSTMHLNLPYTSTASSAKFCELLNDVFMYTTCYRHYRLHSLHLVFSMLVHSELEHDIQIMLLILCNILHLGLSVTFATMYECLKNNNNKETYFKLRQCKQQIFFITQMNSCRGWLSLATFHYMIGQYRKALGACKAVTSLMSHSTIYNGTVINMDRLLVQWCGRGIPSHIKYKNTFMNSIVLTKGRFDVALPELNPEVHFASVMNIPPLSYASFVSFLCHYRLKDRENAMLSFHDLKAHSEFDIARTKRPLDICIIYNILGICYQMLGENRWARQCYMKSMKIEPKFLATKFRLESLP